MNPEKIRPKYNSEPQSKIPANFKRFIGKMTFFMTHNQEHAPDKASELSKKDREYVKNVMARLDFALSGRRTTNPKNAKMPPTPTKDSLALREIVDQNISSGKIYPASGTGRKSEFLHNDQFAKEQAEILSNEDFSLPQEFIDSKNLPVDVTPEIKGYFRQVIKDIKILAGNSQKCYEIINQINKNAINPNFSYHTIDQKTGIPREMTEAEIKQYNPSYNDRDSVEDVAQALGSQGYHL